MERLTEREIEFKGNVERLKEEIYKAQKELDNWLNNCQHEKTEKLTSTPNSLVARCLICGETRGKRGNWK